MSGTGRKPGAGPVSKSVLVVETRFASEKAPVTERGSDVPWQGEEMK